jgi:hypothetical protein
LKAAPRPQAQQQTEDEHRPQSVDLVVDNTHEIPTDRHLQKVQSGVIFLAKSVADINVVTVPFALITSARSLAPASPIWLLERLRPDQSHSSKRERSTVPQSVDLVVVSIFGQPQSEAGQSTRARKLNKPGAEDIKQRKLGFSLHS